MIGITPRCESIGGRLRYPVDSRHRKTCPRGKVAQCSCAGSHPTVLIETELGGIRVELFEDRAPVTVANFLRYANEGIFTDAAFYRTVRMDNQPDNDVKIEVIQGGLYEEERMHPPSLHETTEATGILHRDGVISMARNEPGSATSEFFICVGDQPELDFGAKRNPDGQGFAAFGRVIEGMDVVRAIHGQPADGQWLRPHIRIVDITRSPRP